MKNIKKAIIERINRIPKDVRISVSSDESYSPEEIIEHINAGDRLGKKILQIESEYIKYLEAQKNE